MNFSLDIESLFSDSVATLLGKMEIIYRFLYEIEEKIQNQISVYLHPDQIELIPNNYKYQILNHEDLKDNKVIFMKIFEKLERLYISKTVSTLESNDKTFKVHSNDFVHYSFNVGEYLTLDVPLSSKSITVINPGYDFSNVQSIVLNNYLRYSLSDEVKTFDLTVRNDDYIDSHIIKIKLAKEVRRNLIKIQSHEKILNRLLEIIVDLLINLDSFYTHFTNESETVQTNPDYKKTRTFSFHDIPVREIFYHCSLPSGFRGYMQIENGCLFIGYIGVHLNTAKHSN